MLVIHCECNDQLFVLLTHLILLLDQYEVTTPQGKSLPHKKSLHSTKISYFILNRTVGRVGVLVNTALSIKAINSS